MTKRILTEDQKRAHAAAQARYHARQQAKLRARTDDGCPNWNFPDIDTYFGNAPTLEQVMAAVSPELRSEVAMEAEREAARLERGDEDEDD
jgi:hypothetical protein